MIRRVTSQLFVLADQLLIAFAGYEVGVAEFYVKMDYSHGGCDFIIYINRSESGFYHLQRIILVRYEYKISCEGHLEGHFYLNG